MFSSRLATAALLAIAAAGAPSPAPAQSPSRVVPVERIVAIVNDEVITAGELDDQRKVVLDQLRRQGTPAPAPDVLEKQLLERMITERAQLQFAKETGIRVEEQVLDRAIARIAEDNKLDVAALRASLEREGVPFARFREEVRSEIIANRVREREVESRVIVTDAEIDNFLANQQARGGANDEYRLAHVLVLVPEKASPEQIEARRQRALEAKRQIDEGRDFAQVAAAFSDAPDALAGGVIGWRSVARMPTIFAEAVRGLKPGDSSGVLRSPNGFHVVKVLETRGREGPTVIDQTRVRHILVRANEITSEAEARAKIDRIRERIERGAKFEDMARLNSEDPSSARGGELGWVSQGDTVPEFERAMDGLAVGALSQPVRTPFGWHLIEVLDRRKEDVTLERSRALARQSIRARKADEAYQDWLRQLRDRAYVEYRSEDR